MTGSATLEAPAPPATTVVEPTDPSRRRFTVAVVVGAAVVSIPYLWVLWDLWTGGVSPLRSVDPANFYDLQARAMFSGHLFIPKGDLGIEAFVHAGHEYTYFGIFPSLLRMPLLLVTHRFDGRLTAPSILLSWLVTGLFSAVLLWRLRVMMVGGALLGRAEAVSYGALMATILGGSVLVDLASSPWVYNEDFAWSVALTTGSLFALLGVMERPSRWRVLAGAALVLAANLNRSPTGYACVIGALLVGAWLALGRERETTRRWALPVLLLAGVVPFLASCAVTYAKFGIPIGLPMADQVWSQLNAHRRYFLAANGGKAFSVGFIPSTLSTYLSPAGLRLSGIFPFVTLPATPPTAVGGAVLDQTYPSASITASMPLLFLLSCWGLVTAFRPRGTGRPAPLRVLLLTAGAATAGVLVWGYIADRYMADFMPLLVLASAIGLIDIWRRLAGSPPRFRTLATAAVVVLAVVSVVINVAVSLGPTQQWSIDQTDQFLDVQRLGSLQPLGSTVEHGSALPEWAPAGQLYEVGRCAGLYVSSGESYRNVPGQDIQHLTWMPVHQRAGINHTVAVTVNQPGFRRPFPLLSDGRSTLVIESAGPGWARLRIENPGVPRIGWPTAVGWRFRVAPHRLFWFDVMTDPYLHTFLVRWLGAYMIGHYLASSGPAVVRTTPASAGTPVAVADVTAGAQATAPADPSAPVPSGGLCRRLTHT